MVRTNLVAANDRADLSELDGPIFLDYFKWFTTHS